MRISYQCHEVARMEISRLLSRIMRPLPRLCIVAAAILLASGTTRAEIVVDDFDDSAVVTEITRSTERPAVTKHVGNLDAFREMFFVASQTNPNGSFDANVQSPSLLSAEFDGHEDTSVIRREEVVFGVRYRFSPADLTEDRENVAFLFDFASHQGTELPLFLRITARGPSSGPVTYAGYATDFGFSDAPFTEVIPFSALILRGGGAVTADLSTIDTLTFDFYFYDPSEDIAWSAKLDRIRIGRIPEPDSRCLWGMAVSVLACCRRACNDSKASSGRYEMGWNRAAS